MAYGACAKPDDQWAARISYLIAPDGVIRHVWPKVSVKTHATDVLAQVA
jgi:peroxiredoxin